MCLFNVFEALQKQNINCVLEGRNSISPSIFMIIVGDPTSNSDKTIIVYIVGGNPHLTSRFCRVELGLNSYCKMV